jgi:hypothetical protein
LYVLRLPSASPRFDAAACRENALRRKPAVPPANPYFSGKGTIFRKEASGMGRFLIEVPHEEETIACAKVVEIFLRTGSHFVTHTDWGCRDGDHKAWLIVEVDSKEDARMILPPAFRSQAKIVGLNKFSMEEIDDILRYHRKKAG